VVLCARKQLVPCHERSPLPAALLFFSFSSADRAGGAEVGGAGRADCAAGAARRQRCLDRVSCWTRFRYAREAWRRSPHHHVAGAWGIGAGACYGEAADRPPDRANKVCLVASTILGTLTRARGARRRFQIAVSFFSFSSATEATAPRSDGAGRADRAAGAAAAAELRRHRRWPPPPPLRRRGAALTACAALTRAREGVGRR
jgi:hypothetical protein